MATAAEMQVRVSLSANPKTKHPDQEGAIVFKYAPGKPLPENATVQEDGTIDLSGVKSEVRIHFDIVEPADMKLEWESGSYKMALRSNEASKPERQSLWLAKGDKPTGPYPFGEKEFDAFYYSGNENKSIHVLTRNTDNTASYWYALAVTLRKEGELNPANDIVCRDDPQIRNGGNPINALSPFWPVAVVIVVANAITALLVGLLLR